MRVRVGSHSMVIYGPVVLLKQNKLMIACSSLCFLPFLAICLSKCACCSIAVGRMHHPFHLHGYQFMVTGLGRNPDGSPLTVAAAKRMESRSLLPRSATNTRPPFKDTVSIPSRGYAIVRFRATNPGEFYILLWFCESLI